MVVVNVYWDQSETSVSMNVYQGTRGSVSANLCTTPDRQVHGANIGSIWGRQDPGGPHVGPTNFVICVYEWATLLKHADILYLPF